MWAAPADKPPPTPEMFDEHYRKPLPSGAETIVEILELSGSLDGKRVLDLGGGCLLLETGTEFAVVDYSEKYTVVDYSREAVRRAERYRNHGVQIVWSDVNTYLKHNYERFDIVLCFGLVEYLPDYFLGSLFSCLAYRTNVLCFGTSSGESYLQYPGRVVSYTEDDVGGVASAYGWIKTKSLDRPSHVLARYERVS